MKYLYVLLMLASFSFANAQLSVLSTTPANNDTNVPLTTTFSVTFSAALDTTYQFGPENGLFWSVENASAPQYSPDHRTVTFDVVLSPDQVYIVAVYYARAEGGGTLQVPYGMMFTTGASFAPYSVSGNVFSGTTGVSPANALVLLSTTPLSQGNPQPVSGTIADGTGAFVLPHVPNGTYYPLAAKDANGDGNIDPSQGDVVAAGDSITVSGGNVTGVNLTFFIAGSISLTDAIPIADSISGTLPPDKTLRLIQSYQVDSVGGADNWEFYYLRNTLSEGYQVRVGALDRNWEMIDSVSSLWLTGARPITNPGSAASSSVFLTNVENAGGYAFRTTPPGGGLSFNGQASLGDLRWTNFWPLITDTTRNYWGAEYSFGYDSSNQWVEVTRKQFLGDYTTGTILVVTDVKANGSSSFSTEFALGQNYPNPFNPSTQISFTVSEKGLTTLKVYNLIGQEVATLVQGVVPAGEYTVHFDAGKLASGMYFYRLASGSQAITHRMILMK